MLPIEFSDITSSRTTPRASRPTVDSSLVVVVDQTPLWVEAFDAVGAAAAFLAAVGGATVAVLYGRRANVAITGTAHVAVGRIVVALRPSVRAVGVLSLHFAGVDGAQVEVTEVLAGPDGLDRGLTWERSAVFGDDFVSAGETLTTTMTVDVGVPPVNLVGWEVSFGIAVARLRPAKNVWTWADQAFVARPEGV